MLTEDDVPGAKLDVNPAAATVVQLKRWLSCRQGASTTGKKPELVNRVNDYINGGLSQKLLINPDSASGCTKRPCPVTLSCRFHHPPKEGWTSDLSKVPGGICYGTMWNFLVNQPHLQEKASGCDKQFGKGYRLYCSGHVTEVQYHPMSELSSFVYLKATVLPSMKKTLAYTCYISVWQSSLDIHSAYCTCPAGLSGICCHVAAFLYACSATSVSSSTTNSSCTSLPQQWHVPSRKRKVDNLPIHEALFQKHDPTKPNKRKPKIRQIDPRPIGLQKNNHDKVHQLRHKLENLAAQGKACALLHVLPFAPSSSAISWDHNYAASLHSNASEIQHPCFVTAVTSNSTADSLQPADLPVMTSASSEVHTMQTDSQLQSTSSPSENLSRDVDFKKKCIEYEEAERLTLEEIKQIEYSTRGQSVNDNWHRHRQGKVTASVAGAIINKRETTPPDNLLKKIMGYDKQRNIPKACRHGIQCEPKAAHAYVEYMKMNGHPDISLKETGLAIMPEHSWLGASVDRIVDDPVSQPREGNVEIKCPAANLTISNLAVQRGSSFPLRKDKMGALKLNQHHGYYHQVQCQLAVTQREWCDFVMYTETPQGSDIFVERIVFNREVWKTSTFPKLKEFYIGSVVPEILTRRVALGFPLFPEAFQYKNTKDINESTEE